MTIVALWQTRVSRPDLCLFVGKLMKKNTVSLNNKSRHLSFLRFLFLIACTLQLTGCVSTRLTNSSRSISAEAINKVVIVYIPATFAGPYNMASSLGSRNLSELVPHLKTRLVPLFISNGLQARVVDFEQGGNISVQQGELILSLRATEAAYSSRSGQSLSIDVDIFDPVTRKSSWKGAVRMATLGFGKFDELVAESIGNQIIQELKTNQLLNVSNLSSTSVGGNMKKNPEVALPEDVPKQDGPILSSSVTPKKTPSLDTAGQEAYEKYKQRPFPRYFAIDGNGAWGWASRGVDPMQTALSNCAKRGGVQECRVYSFNDKIIWEYK